MAGTALRTTGQAMPHSGLLYRSLKLKGLFINDVSFFIDLHSIKYTLFYSVQVYKKADVIYEQPLSGAQ